MKKRRWFDASQPQTLQGAVLLSYLNAVFALLYLVAGGYVGLFGLFGLAEGAAAFGMANERRWGYWTGVVAALIGLLLSLSSVFVFHDVGTVINLAFAAILVALLLHPQSREYQRIWFR
jgi:hypothetical protein